MAKATTAQTSSRSSARETATGAGQTGGTGRRPKPDDNTGGGTQETAAAPQMDPKQHALVCIAPNPKRANSKAYGFYAKYGKPGVLTDIFQVRDSGVRGKDISWDRDRRHILIGEEALAFDELGGDRDKQAAYLKSLGVVDKDLIKWGYMDAPVEQPAENVKADA